MHSAFHATVVESNVQDLSKCVDLKAKHHVLVLMRSPVNKDKTLQHTMQ